MNSNPTGITVLILALAGSGVALGYAVSTLYLASYPVKPDYRGPAYEIRLLALFIKKHLVGLGDKDLRTYRKNVDVAKNVFLTVLQLPFSIAAAGWAIHFFREDQSVDPRDIMISSFLLLIALYQVRIYGSEKRIYDNKVPVSPFAKFKDSREFTKELHSSADTIVLQETTVRAKKPIYERIDREKMIANARSTDIKKLIEDDKAKVEARLEKSKYSNVFEISGSPSNPKAE